MGYETRLVFIKKPQKAKGHRAGVGYCSVLAELEMGKVADDAVGALIARITNENKKKITGKTAEIKKALEKLRCEEYAIADNIGSDEFDAYCEKNEGARERYDEAWKAHQYLEKHLPHAYIGGRCCFEDCYGDLLMIAELEDLEKAIRFDQAKLIANKEYGPKGYRRFDVALAMIEKFKDVDFWTDVAVIVYGH